MTDSNNRLSRAVKTSHAKVATEHISLLTRRSECHEIKTINQSWCIRPMPSDDRLFSEPPLPLAMIICDQVYKDTISGKTTILGAFSNILATKTPYIQSLSVYLELTDTRGEIALQVRIIDANEENPPLIAVEGQVSSTDPREVLSIALYFGNVHFPTVGEYRIQAYANDQFVIERRVLVLLAGE
jgi:hypothetical protein